MPRCTMCHRNLTDTTSIQRGYGDDCLKKYQAYLAECGTTLEEVALLSLHPDATARKWVEVAGRAIRSKKTHHMRDAKGFIEAARRAAAMAECEAVAA